MDFAVCFLNRFLRSFRRSFYIAGSHRLYIGRLVVGSVLDVGDWARWEFNFGFGFGFVGILAVVLRLL